MRDFKKAGLDVPREQHLPSLCRWPVRRGVKMQQRNLDVSTAEDRPSGGYLSVQERGRGIVMYSLKPRSLWSNAEALTV